LAAEHLGSIQKLLPILLLAIGLLARRARGRIPAAVFNRAQNNASEPKSRSPPGRGRARGGGGAICFVAAAVEDRCWIHSRRSASHLAPRPLPAQKSELIFEQTFARLAATKPYHSVPDVRG